MQMPSVEAAPVWANKRAKVPVLSSLTGIRAVAALFVVVYHYGESATTLFPAFARMRPLYRVGGIGVDLFFVLSGFILCHNYLDGLGQFGWRSYRRFLQARLARVYPVHLAALLLLTVVAVGAAEAGKPMNPVHYSVGRWFANLFLVQIWPPIGSTFSWNYPAWSVSAEWFAYLLFPLFTIWIGRARRPGFWAAASLAAYGVPVAAGWLRPGHLLDWSVLRVTAEFLYGSFLYRMYRNRPRCPLPPLPAGALSIAATLACSYWGMTPGLAVAVYGLLLWSLASVPDGPLGSRVWVYLGQLSYSLYMTHGVLQILLNRVVPVEHFSAAHLPMRCAVMGLYLALIAVAAVGTYHLVEVPGRQLLLGRMRLGGSGHRRAATEELTPLPNRPAAAEAQ